MKVMSVVFALVALSSGFKIETKNAKLVTKTKQCGPDETPCPPGCWLCGCGPDDTLCPSGCCPEANWYCCPDDWCAATADDCPYQARKAQLVKLAKTKTDQCGPNQASCWSGCCPEEYWVCCPDQLLAPCAVAIADCPVVAKKAQLIKMSKTRQCGPDETSCPGGCCPEANWFCCPDATYCAATAADCPFVEKKARLEKLAKTKNNQCGPDETTCPNGCCPEANWFCCPDYMCAKVPEDCAFADKRVSLTVLS